MKKKARVKSPERAGIRKGRGRGGVRGKRRGRGGGTGIAKWS